MTPTCHVLPAEQGPKTETEMSSFCCKHQSTGKQHVVRASFVCASLGVHMNIFICELQNMCNIEWTTLKIAFKAVCVRRGNFVID